MLSLALCSSWLELARAHGRMDVLCACAKAPASLRLVLENGQASKSPGSPSGKRIPGLNRSHSSLELQLAEMLEIAQMAGGDSIILCMLACRY